MDEAVPTIDLAVALTGSTDARTAVARQLDKACRTSGFFVITGHGVPDSLVRSVVEESRHFFHLPPHKKAVVAPPGPDHFRGYLGLDTTSLAATLGNESPPDLCESFNISRFDDPVRRASAQRPGAEAVFHPNLWPDEPPGLRAAYEAYFEAMETLAQELLALIELALALPAGWFDDKFDEPTSLLLANWYPPVSGELLPGQLRRGAHTDYGMLTIVAVEQIPGLQVLLDDQWTGITTTPGGFVVNLGDLLERWTNDRWQSTLHRVVIPDDDHRDSERISVPFFLQPTYDAVIETIPTTVTEETPAAHQPVVSGEWILRKSMSMLEE